mmetsp:Transcript_6685/g.27976  ORF Transcript_6685/g.27976 Transcript_6685/m.27976 type:complete len:940 (+) Transcript_6685:1270-4089(+)
MVPVVAIAGLGAVDVPLGRRVALADDLLHQHEGTRHHGAAGFGGVEEVLLVHLLGLGVVADEDDVDLLVVPRQEQVEQDEEALGEVLAAFVHRAGHVHQAEHDGAGRWHRDAGAGAKAQVDRVEEGNGVQPRAQLGDALARLGQQPLGLGAVFLQQLLLAGFELVQFAALVHAQRDAPAQGPAHRAHDVQIGRRAVRDEAGALRAPLGRVGQRRAGEVGQGQVVEEDLHELFLAEVEDEVVLALALVAGLAAAGPTALTTLGLGDAVTLDVLLVAGPHHLAHAAVAVAEDGFAQVLLRDVDVLAAFHVADAAAIHCALDRLADLLLVAPEKALAVADGLVLARQAPINDLLEGHASPPCSAGLAHPQVPLAQQPHLLGRVALVHHALHEVLVLLGVLGAGLGVEADDGQQLLGVGEHLLLDHRAQLLVAGPVRVLARVVGAGAQHEIDDLVAEVLGVGDARGLLDLLQLGVQRRAVEDLTRVGVAVLLVLDPVVGIGHVAVEDVLAVLGITLQVGGLDLLADELGIARAQLLLDEADVLLLQVLGELLALDLLLQHIHQVHRIRGDLGRVEVEDLGQDLVREARADAAHAFVHTGVVAVLLVALGARVGVLQVLAVVDLHLGVQRRVLGLLQPCQHRELAHHLQCARGALGLGQRRAADQLLVDLDLFADAQAVGHLDDVDAVEEGLVVLVVAEGLPLALVAVRQHDAVERDRAEAFGALVVALLRGGQQRVQHLDRRLEHLDEFQQALVGQAQAAGVAVGVGVVLRERFQLADVDLADQAGDVLVVLVARLGLGHAELLEHAGVALDDLELADVAAEFVEPLDGPGRQDAVQVAARDAIVALQQRAVLGGVEQAQRAFVHRRAGQRVEGHLLHQLLQPLGNAALAAAHRAQQVEDLFLFLQPLRSVSEIGHHLLDGFLQAVELGEGRVDLDRLVGEEA